MTQTESPKIVKKKLFSPVWLLPVVALLLGIWLLAKGIKDAGEEITIHFPNATGIQIGKTLVKYQGVNVGNVTDIAIDDKQKGVIVTVNMNYRGQPFLKDKTQFWLVSPKASITKIEGLDTLFSGNYIALKPGEGEKRTDFEAVPEAPPQMPASEGMLLTLYADDLGSIDIGAHIFYRQIPVGKVVSYRLDNADRVAISVFIQKRFTNLIKQDSKFWNISGVKVDASLAGVKLEAESLASLIEGGITFSSPKDSLLAESGQIYNLFDSKEEALGGQSFILTSDNSHGLNKGSMIVYRGVSIGQINNKRVTDKGVELDARIHYQYANLLTASAKFWLAGAKLSLSEFKHPERLITGPVVQFFPGKGASKKEYTLLTSIPEVAKQKNVPIEISSEQNFGLKKDTVIKYRNITIGKVNAVKLSKNFQKVHISAEIFPEFKALLKSGYYFVPQSALEVNASLDNVSVKTADLSSALSGALNLETDLKSSNNYSSHFNLYASKEEAKKEATKNQYLFISLTSPDAADLQNGSPIYYKKMQIGSVRNIRWTKQNDEFDIVVGIHKDFNSLINSKTVFWKNSAVSVDAKLSGIKVNVAPLKGAIKGSISLGLAEHSSKIKRKPLYATKTLAMAQATPIEITFNTGTRLTKGAAIKFQSHPIGMVATVRLNKDLKTVTATAFLYSKFANHFKRRDTQYYIVDAQISLAGIKSPETLISGAYISAIPGQAHQITSEFKGELSEEALALIPQGATEITLVKDELGSIQVGTGIYFRGIKIGQVDGYRLAVNGNQVRIKAHINSDYRRFINKSSRFWEQSGIKIDAGIFSGVHLSTGSFENILAGGISVATEQLTNTSNELAETESFELYPESNPDWLEWKFN
ncbi:PqiB family protein [Parashewanella tropica]|uniref:PqiB family protein n=1 Tax=Parashewanella tropica TaxID=2547970 RepID=UPI00105A38C0|nr:MlaD family protein [Parashewanella tropica]